MSGTLDDNVTVQRLARVNVALARVVQYMRARWESEMPGSFVRVTSGLRTPAEQAALIKKGLSHDPKSLHLDGLAVDLVVIEGGRARYDRVGYYRLLGQYFRDGVARVGAPGFQPEWGGEWTMRDYGHFALRPKAAAEVAALPPPIGQ